MGLGLLFAGLFDRVRRESLAKTFVFLPLAISLVGAIGHLEVRLRLAAAGQPQFGLLNAIVVGLRRRAGPVGQTVPINLPAEIVIMIWLQTGFAMVVFSAAIKGVSGEVLEAARLDGASERQLFVRVIVPMIRGSIVTVATTIAIVTLKIFDIVYVDRPADGSTTTSWPTGCSRRSSSSSRKVAPPRSRHSSSSPCCR